MGPVFVPSSYKKSVRPADPLESLNNRKKCRALIVGVFHDFKISGGEKPIVIEVGE